jgi:predicted GH43/DUF377 family glycosyl hydrolase
MKTSLRSVLPGAALAATLASLPAASDALVRFDFEQPYFTEYPLRIKDHSLVRKDGLFHIFYIRDTDENDFGHATSSDLIHWTIHDPVMGTVPGTWEGSHIWAPNIIQPFSDIYYMYYTGVNTSSAQQTGMAFSGDLWSWFKYPSNPVFHPDTSWALWSETTWSNCRDPDVFWYDGQWHMINTAAHKWYKGAVSHAVSDNLLDWEDAGWLYRHNNFDVFESCQMEIENGRFYLFFTDQGVPGTSVMSADALTGPYDISTRIVIDRGHAPEIDTFDGVRIFSRHAAYYDGHGNYNYAIGFDTLDMSGVYPLVKPAIRVKPEWPIVEGSAFTFQPVFRNNPYFRGENIDPNFEGDSWIGTYEYFQGPLGQGTPGATQGYTPKGAIRSKSFVLEGNSINFLIGGGKKPNECYLALIDEDTNQWVRRATGEGAYAMKRRAWDVRDLKGKTVHFVIADSSSDVDGYINVDDIVESYDMVNSGPVIGPSLRRTKKDIGSSAARSPVRSVPSSTGITLGNEPNPFNPTTVLVYSLPEPSEVRVRIYDARGARVRDLFAGSVGAGDHRLIWDGRDAGGRRLPSGVYFFSLEVNGGAAGRHKMTLIK